MQKVKVFISYSHQDEDYKDTLVKHLTLLKRSGVIDTWDDRKITPGEEWDKKIKKELEEADIILLLVSIDFLSSNYCNDVEIKRAIERHEKAEAVVIPIIVRSCTWSSAYFGKLQALPENAKPIKTFVDQDEAFVSIIKGIESAIEDLKTKKNAISITIKSVNDGSIPIYIKINECDTPPNNSYWVGRENEIHEIAKDLHKVVFISGIGGQGKSSIASYYVKEIVAKNSNWEFWDWRDCKEKEDRIHTKIISIIVRLSKGQIPAAGIADATIDDLIDLLFGCLENRNIVFVFDNIDAYVEYDTFQLVGTVKKLYLRAINHKHTSKFIFTCRASINDINTDLLSIKLQGLNYDNTLVLFKAYSLSLKHEQIEVLAKKSFDLTKGHPLWLNLIAAQVRRGVDLDKFIKGIKKYTNFQEDDISSMLSDKILSIIWEDLNDKQKTLLRALAEIIRSETQDNLALIITSELNNNQFVKAFKTLKQLNLLVTKSSENQEDTYELHPLVKEYIVQSFGRNERHKYISLIGKYIDNIIIILKPKLSPNQPLSFYERWTEKIELAVNKNDYKEALLSLEEVSLPICEAGYVEEYIRCANLLFITIDWQTAINQEYSYFTNQLLHFTKQLTHFGKFSEANAFLTKYEKHITNKGERYIGYCEAKGYYYWFRSEYMEALEILQEAKNLDEQSQLQRGSEMRHTWALVMRDTKEQANIEKALAFFLGDLDLEKIMNQEKDLHVSGEIYGNVGRCLQFLNRTDEALNIYKKSLKNLTGGLNRGYAYSWIAECLIKNNIIESVWFYKRAQDIWSKVSPIKAQSCDKKLKAMLEINAEVAAILTSNERIVENHCNSWLNL